MAKSIQLNVVDLGGGVAMGGGCDCEAPNLSGYATKAELPTKLSELENDAEYLTATALIPALQATETITAGGTTAFKDELYNGSVSKYVLSVQAYGSVGSDIEFFFQNVGDGTYLSICTATPTISGVPKTFYMVLENYGPMTIYKVYVDGNEVKSGQWDTMLMLFGINTDSSKNITIKHYY